MARNVQFRAAKAQRRHRHRSFDAVLAAVEELTGEGHEVAILTDLGSADMTVDSVLEINHNSDPGSDIAGGRWWEVPSRPP